MFVAMLMSFHTLSSQGRMLRGQASQQCATESKSPFSFLTEEELGEQMDVGAMVALLPMLA